MQTAHPLGHVERLSDKEVELASAYNLRPGRIERAWEYRLRRPGKATSAASSKRKSMKSVHPAETAGPRGKASAGPTERRVKR